MNPMDSDLKNLNKTLDSLVGSLGKIINDSVSKMSDEDAIKFNEAMKTHSVNEKLSDLKNKLKETKTDFDIQ